MKKFCLFVLTILLVVTKGFSVDDPVRLASVTGTSVQVGAVLTNFDDKMWLLSEKAKVQTTHSIKTWLGVGINESYVKSSPYAFNAKVTLRIEYYIPNNVNDPNDIGHTLYTQTKDFFVDYNPAQGTKYAQNNTLILNHTSKIRITVDSLVFTNNPAGTDPSEYLEVFGNMQSNRDYNFNVATAVSGLSINNSNPVYDELPVRWNPAVGQTEYDLEWTWIQQSTVPANTQLLFNNNATRVTIPGDSIHYNIPLIYNKKAGGTGTLYYRIRTAQILENKRRFEGVWCAPVAYTPSVGHEELLNWQSTASYAEDGKRKVVVQYFDGSLKARQTVTKDNTLNQTIVAETYYDFQGRPAVQVMPVPTISSIIAFTPQFNKGINDPGYFEKKLFDRKNDTIATCSVAADGMSTVSGASNYYSPQNPDLLSTNPLVAQQAKYIPDAQKFPFSQVQYTLDNTGRTVAQGGVGPDHRIGSAHDTKTYMDGKVDQQELDALFGTEAGFASYYTKTMVKDPNGQFTVSYSDMNGKTVATALAGGNPTALQPLVVDTPGYAYKRESDILRSSLLDAQTNVINGKSLTSSSDLLIPGSNTTLNFTYKLDPAGATFQSCFGTNICYECLYNLKIDVLDECGYSLYTKYRTGIKLAQPCTTGAPFPFIDTFSVVLEKPGMYTINKVLTLDDSTYRRNLDTFLVKNNCKSQQDIYNTLHLNAGDCAVTCSACIDSLGTLIVFKSRYAAVMGWDLATITAAQLQEITDVYQEQLEVCNSICPTQAPGSLNSKIRGMQEAMLQDLTPVNLETASTPPVRYEAGGQYAKYYNQPTAEDIFGNIFYGAIPPVSQPHPDLSSVNIDTAYYNADGTYALTAYTITDPASKINFIQNFQDHWTSSLIYYHPEYKLLAYLKKYANGIFNYQDQLANFTFAQATTAGLTGSNYIAALNATCYNNAALDAPLGLTDAAANQSAALSLLMDNYDNQSYHVFPTYAGHTMWQIAYYAVKFSGNTANIANLNNSPRRPDQTVNTAGCPDLDRVWQTFISLYLGKKNLLLYNYLKGNTTLGMPDVEAIKTAHPNLIINLPLYPGTGGPAFGSTVAGATAVAQASLYPQFETSCSSYIDQWKTSLNNCLQNGSPIFTAAEIDALVLKMKRICIAGSDVNHALGSSTMSPDSSVAGLPRSFEQLIAQELAAKNYTLTDLCNPNMIIAPLPYLSNQTLVTNSVTGTLQPCECDRIAAYKTLYNNFIAQNPGTFMYYNEYLKINYGITITMGKLDTLQRICTPPGLSCRTITPPFKLPVIFNCGAPLPPAATQCITCDSMQVYLNAFYNTYGYSQAPYVPALDTLQQAANDNLVRFLNARTHFTKSLSEYLQFIQACKIPIRGGCEHWAIIIQNYNSGIGLKDTISCTQQFANWYNVNYDTTLSYEEILLIKNRECPTAILPCEVVQSTAIDSITCQQLGHLVDSFRSLPPIPPATGDPVLDCRNRFTDFFNHYYNTSYTFYQIQQIFRCICGYDLPLCNGTIDCAGFTQVIANFHNIYGYPQDSCQTLFTQYFNSVFNTSYTFTQLQQLYATVCGGTLDVCANPINCETLANFLVYFNTHFPNAGQNSHCSEDLVQAFSQYYGVSYSYAQILNLLKRCRLKDPCKAIVNPCEQLTSVYAGFIRDVKPTLTPQDDCYKYFVNYFNQQMGTNYTLNEIINIYQHDCGQWTDPCAISWDCRKLEDIWNLFIQQYPHPEQEKDCRKIWEVFFNSMMGGTTYTYDEIITIYVSNCGLLVDPCGPKWDCDKLTDIWNSFQEEYPHADSLQNCRELWVRYFNSVFGSNYTYESILAIYSTHCGLMIHPCEVGADCTGLDSIWQTFLIKYPRISQQPNCQAVWVNYFNSQNGNSTLNYDQIIALYASNCGIQINPCGQSDSCVKLDAIWHLFVEKYGDVSQKEDCREIWTKFFNESNEGTSYSYDEILAFYLECGTLIDPCGPKWDCSKLADLWRSFQERHPNIASSGDCRDVWVQFFNNYFGTSYSYEAIIAIYATHCGMTISPCVIEWDCVTLKNIWEAYFDKYPNPALLANCKETWVGFFNLQYGTQYSYEQIQEIYQRNCGILVDPCGQKVSCTQLNNLLLEFTNSMKGREVIVADCQNKWIRLFNTTFGYNYSYNEIVQLYAASCGVNIDPCNTVVALPAAKTAAENPATVYKAGDKQQFQNRALAQQQGQRKANQLLNKTSATGTGKRVVMLRNDDYQPGKGIAGKNAAKSATSCVPAITLCGFNTALFDVPDSLPAVPDPCAARDSLLSYQATIMFEYNKDSLTRYFDSAYTKKCLPSNTMDSLIVRYNNPEYHYTLYYYDITGHLVKTVPPKGVVKITNPAILSAIAAARIAGTVNVPTHKLATVYRYTSLGGVSAQRTPDGGESKFYFDVLSRLVVSQNAKQSIEGNYSFTQYDSLNRITRVGEKSTSQIMSQSLSQVSTSLTAWLTSGTNKDITETFYDYAALDAAIVTNISQKNLRGRISYSQVKKDGVQVQSGIYYSYDIHGNVDVLLNDYAQGVMQQTSGSGISNRFKKLEYQYDLISGNTNNFCYQRDMKDQFLQRYNYDASNRLVNAEMSSNGLQWEKDAQYKFYKHGALSRLQLGHLAVQGIDYAYNLHGWIKGVNSNMLSDSSDIGKDGYTTGINPLVARDVFNYSPQYYLGDYQAISGNNPFSVINSPNPIKSLYNGNIASMHINMPILGAANYYQYSYDQLNRLVGMGTSVKTDSVTWASSTNYNENISYDANGNIDTYLRNGNKAGAAAAMDRLHYHYNANNNQLAHVTDSVTTSSLYLDDIENQSSGNYSYDVIGNLVKDNADGITRISWNMYGKIDSVYKASFTIAYTYDCFGNRISKIVQAGATINSTHYVRDAQGNVISTYMSDGTNLRQKDVNLYGSARLGIYRVDKDVQMPVQYESVFAPQENGATFVVFVRGNKSFELGNHIGNVLESISDRKVAVYNLLGSNTFTDTLIYYNADVLSAQDYFPFGMTMPGRDTNSSSYKYGFNTQEKEYDIAIGHYSAEFWEYDSRLGRRWNRDPKPIPEESEYAVNRNNPIYNSDPKGDNPILGAIIGAFTEYAGIVGSKMLFENMTFSEANSDLGWSDGLDIAIAAGFGAASGAIDGGITKFASWLKSPTNQKIVAKLLEVGVSALESSLKQIYKDEDFDLKSVLAGALTEVGMGSLLKTDVYKDASVQATKNASVSTKRAEDLAKRRKPNERLVNNAKKEASSQKKTAKAMNELDNTGKTIKGTVAKTAANKVQDATKTEKK